MLTCYPMSLIPSISLLLKQCEVIVWAIVSAVRHSKVTVSQDTMHLLLIEWFILFFILSFLG